MSSGKAYSLIKAFLDIIASIIFILLLSPIFILIIVVLVASTGSPIIYKQKRIGKNLRPFTLYKFRTMVVNASYMEKKGIPKEKLITPVGLFLRRTHLDELPQLFNVLKGDMSLVGPRPLILGEYETHAKINGNYTLIFSELKPGLTDLNSVLTYMPLKKRKRIMAKLGLKLTSDKKLHAKTSRHYHNKKTERLHYYMDNKSLILDLKIICWTFILILKKVLKTLEKK